MKEGVITPRARLCVFCGPSLPQSDRPPIAGVTYVAPASRGDVARACGQYDAILLIDGVFHQELAPTPREVYDAIARLRVFGASSMGALRAVEVAPYGAIPLGIVAGWYRSGTIDGDDEVAVLVDSSTQRALTVPSVNVRYVCWLARRRGILDSAEAESIVARARDLFYADRTWESVRECVPGHARPGFEAIVESGADLKRIDARFALRSALRYLRRGGSAPEHARSARPGRPSDRA